MSKPSIILMGSKPGSVVALDLLVERGWDVRAVVVSRSLGHPFIAGPTLAERAHEHGVPVFSQPALPESTRADFVVSYMYRYRVRPHVIAMASRAALNFHPAPLPEYGGWAFYNVAILERATSYGPTCHVLEDEFDTGDLVRVDRFPIDPARETCVSLERKTQEQMIRTFAWFCELAESGAPIPRERQDSARFRYMDKAAFDALKRIPEDADAETVDRHARAFWYPPYQCAWTQAGSASVEVVPEISKEELAHLLHADDYARLRRIGAAISAPSTVAAP